MTEQSHISSRLADDPASDLSRLLAVASDIPSSRVDAARNRVWRRMSEEALAHQGHAPLRLFETDDFSAALLAKAATIEPPYAKQAALLRKLRPEPSHRFRFIFAGASMAFAALLLVAVPKMIDHGTTPAEQPIASNVNVARPMAEPEVHIVPVAPKVAVQPAAQVALAVQGTDLRIVRPDGTIAQGQVAVGDSLWPAGTEPAHLKIAGVGEAELSGDGAQLTLAESDSHGVRLTLAQGRVAIHADKRSPDAPLVIIAQGVEVRVVGTIFAVKTGTDGPAVGVREGLVRVTAPGKAPIELSAGHYWTASVTTASDDGWADETMGKLAGVLPTPSLAQLAVQMPQPAPAEEAVQRTEHRRHHRTESPAEVAKAESIRQEAAKPAELVAALKSAPMYGTPGFKSSATEVVVTAAPGAVIPNTAAHPAVASAKAEGPGIAGPVFDLDVEAVKYDGRSPSELSVAEARNRRRGASGLHDLAVVYRALADNPSANPGQKRAANRSLAELLDNEMGAVRMAVGVWRELAPRLDAADRSQARLAILADEMEMGNDNAALVAAGDCLRECEGDQKAFGLVLQARLLALEGQIEEARAATMKVFTLTNAFRKTAFFFAQRAEKFDSSGQHPRAKVAAELSLALDPMSIQAPELRAITHQ